MPQRRRSPTSPSATPARAIAWYADVLGAAARRRPYRDAGRPHRPRRARASPARRSTSPTSTRRSGVDRPRAGRVAGHPAPARVPDVDAAVAACPAARRDRRARRRRRAVRPHRRGRRPVRPPLDAADADPPRGARPPTRAGDTVYLTLRVPDGARARDFYEAVLGWSAAPGRVPDGWQVEGTTPMVGIWGGDGGRPGWCRCTPSTTSRSPSRPCGRRRRGRRHRVAAVRAHRQCRDDQGLPFYLGQLS